jgi:hypothetical protein
MKLAPTFYTSAPLHARVVFYLAQQLHFYGDHGAKIPYRVGGDRQYLMLLQLRRSQ